LDFHWIHAIILPETRPPSYAAMHTIFFPPNHILLQLSTPFSREACTFIEIAVIEEKWINCAIRIRWSNLFHNSDRIQREHGAGNEFITGSEILFIPPLFEHTDEDGQNLLERGAAVHFLLSIAAGTVGSPCFAFFAPRLIHPVRLNTNTWSYGPRGCCICAARRNSISLFKSAQQLPAPGSP
jgi:hypothetical protein